MRPRSRPRPKHYEAEANELCNIQIHITFILHIIYHKIDISQTELS